VAHYFNAQAGARQVVVSWTGEEVEYYSGMNTSAPMVAAAFKLQGFAAWRFMAARGRSFFNGRILTPAALAVAIMGIAAACFIGVSRSRGAPPAPLIQAPPGPLRVGASGVLNDTAYYIAGQQLLEMARVGRRWQRRQYDLTAPDDQPAWLTCDPGAAGPVWLLYTLLHPDHRLTPLEAGALRAGQTIEVDGGAVAITELFRSTVRSTEGASLSGGETGDVFYGCDGVMSSNWVLLVRWNQTNIIYQQGMPVTPKAVLAAFSQTAGAQAPR
jgi:hypothetical protein